MGPRLATLALSLAASMAWPAGARAADKAACLKAYEAAQRDKNAGKLRAARKNLLVCVEPECPELLQSECSTWLGEVERGMPTVVVVARSGGAELSDVQVLVDDELVADSLTGASLEVDPGRREFRFEASGYAPVTQVVTVVQGDKDRKLAVDFPAKSGDKGKASASPPVASTVLAGVGAVGLLGFSYFGLQGLSGRGDLKQCKGECAQEDVDEVRADFVRADISLAIAALAFGGAAYFYFTAGSDERAPAARRGLRLGIQPRAGGAATALQLAF